MSDPITLKPNDAYNRRLVDHVHPEEWVDPEPARRYNLVIVGAGTAGLVAAAGAAAMGARVALVERHLMGGDCLNFGCVPSKALIRSGRAVADIRKAPAFGVVPQADPEVDFEAVMERMRRLRAEISHHDSAQRFRDLGVDLFIGSGRFTGPDRLEVNDRTLRFSRALIATGARPVVPEIDGLQEAGYLTNETVFSLTRRPDVLLVVGGGPIGCELAQTFRRLGSEVFLVERAPQLLPREDRDAAGILGTALEREGITCLFSAELAQVRMAEGRRQARIRLSEGERTITADEILVGVGRRPNIEGLGLENAGVAFDRSGIEVNDYLQTTNRRIYAAGDVAFPYKFTHTAEATAKIVLQNALFLRSRRHTSLVIPWTTYTDPEIAHVGRYERDAVEQGIRVQTFTHRLKDTDRARLDGETEGFVRLHVREGTDRILGATIVARHAGEMISEVTAAMAGGLGLKGLAGVIHPYPTQAEGIKQTAGAYYRTLLTPLRRRLLGWWFAIRGRA